MIALSRNQAGGIVQRIEDKRPDTIDLLIQDLDLQDILVLNLTRAVQLSVDTGSHIISTTNDRPWVKFLQH
ncbi:MAG: hypothetical protein AABY99_05555 [Pseudomonadota bacterium]